MVVYLLLGGNIGSVRENLRRAREMVDGRVGRVVRASRVYRSPAWGFESPDPFYNVALAVETAMAPDEVMRTLLDIERLLGRRREAAALTDVGSVASDGGSAVGSAGAVASGSAVLHASRRPLRQPRGGVQPASRSALDALAGSAGAVASGSAVLHASRRPLRQPRGGVRPASRSALDALAGSADADASARTYASRPIDIDILFFGNSVLRTALLTVPHPRLAARRFALLPLCEIAPDWVHPECGLTVAGLLAACPDTSEVTPVD